MKDIEKFWLVWRPTGGWPLKRHATYKGADMEARRVALQNMGAEVFVLSACKRIICPALDVPQATPGMLKTEIISPAT